MASSRCRAASGATSIVCGRSAHGSASSASLVHNGLPSARQYRPICQRGNGSPGYHLPWLRCTSPCGAHCALSRAASTEARCRLCGPSASVVHSGSTWLSMETNVGSPPIGEAHVPRGETIVDPRAERLDGVPRRVGVRQRHPRILVHSGHDVGEVECRLGHVGGTGDRCRGRRMRSCRKRNVPLACEQPRRRVEPDPARAGNVDLGPGVQIGEVGGRAGRSVERLHVGGQLDQIAGYEPGGQTHLAQDRHQQPRRVAAGSDAGAQREVGGLHAGFHAQAVADVAVDRMVERDQEVDGAGAGPHREVLHPRLRQVARTGSLVGLVDRA